MSRITHICGIDEAGRGPLAGPVSVGVALVPHRFDWRQIPGVGDSKQLSPEKREALFRRARELKRTGELDFAVSMVAAPVIDRVGISKAIRTAMARALRRLDIEPVAVHVLLDGSLHAPAVFTDQETIIGGDGIEPVIGLASILAKVTRDRHIVRLAKLFPEYGLDVHKGYGTKAHREAIQAYGLSSLHRRSYCRNIVSL